MDFSNAYQFRQLWDALSPRQQNLVNGLAQRALRLDVAATRAYEAGRLDEAELLDEETARTLEVLETTLLEIESESGDLEVDSEADDLLRQIAHLYERYLRGMDPRAGDGLNETDYLRIMRNVLHDATRYAFGPRGARRATDAQLFAAGRDTYDRLHALGRPRQRRDVVRGNRRLSPHA